MVRHLPASIVALTSHTDGRSVRAQKCTTCLASAQMSANVPVAKHIPTTTQPQKPWATHRQLLGTVSKKGRNVPEEAQLWHNIFYAVEQHCFARKVRIVRVTNGRAPLPTRIPSEHTGALDGVIGVSRLTTRRLCSFLLLVLPRSSPSCSQHVIQL